eukprot:CAMPEP_0181133308 /NCGR_PEP_ID=MMETSP1071-20121207/31464_1 /TAXON_ID=35127 /ORGANISM="Thalassiosira sp., Strain NH16" /LENGTH=77 /DNA_ID=CAMNT_0023219709 /DNA_START=452 /DNA_END=685 /DNA_ORIENTATION=+
MTWLSASSWPTYANKPKLKKLNPGASPKFLERSHTRRSENASSADSSGSLGGVCCVSYPRFNILATKAPCCPATCAV